MAGTNIPGAIISVGNTHKELFGDVTKCIETTQVVPYMTKYNQVQAA